MDFYLSPGGKIVKKFLKFQEFWIFTSLHVGSQKHMIFCSSSVWSLYCTCLSKNVNNFLKKSAKPRRQGRKEGTPKKGERYNERDEGKKRKRAGRAEGRRRRSKRIGRREVGRKEGVA
jgi:hypothetical protein